MSVPQCTVHQMSQTFHVKYRYVKEERPLRFNNSNIADCFLQYVEKKVYKISMFCIAFVVK